VYPRRGKLSKSIVELHFGSGGPADSPVRTEATRPRVESLFNLSYHYGDYERMKRASGFFLWRANNIENMTLAAFDFIIVMIHTTIFFSIFAIIEHITYEKLHNKKPTRTFLRVEDLYISALCLLGESHFALAWNGYLWAGAQQVVVFFPYSNIFTFSSIFSTVELAT
jgi:hypothetical protein